MSPMKATIKYNKEWDLNRNAAMLANTIKSEAQAHATSGYWFDFGGGEVNEHKRWCKAADTSAWFMAQAMRDSGMVVEVFRNGNGQMAAKLAKADNDEIVVPPMPPVTASDNLRTALHELGKVRRYLHAESRTIEHQAVWNAIHEIEKAQRKIEEIDVYCQLQDANLG